jgi:BirA family transcriptional regulator, biotin operon repressor / biotin---[acetyl-CoA-carboxylase] ligase
MEIFRRHFTTIDSTNTWSKLNVQLFDPKKLSVITADEQSAGRGRFKRKWESPSQNVFATFCFFLEMRRSDIGNIPQVLAISAFEALEELHFHPQLKWPNDILLSEKKVGGILCETTMVTNGLWVIVGIGINVNMPLDLLSKIDRPATSLFVEKGVPVEEELVTLKLIKHFNINLEKFLQKGFDPFLPTYRQKLGNLKGKKIRFHDNQVIWEGVFHSIKDDGSLNLILDSGVIKNFIAGEIMW